MIRFVSSRRWLLAHVVILAVAGSCVRLGFWQLHRLEERRARNRLTVTRLNLPALSTQTLLGARRDAVGPAFAYRRVELRGTYDPDREAILYGRSFDGRPGAHSLVPLVTSGGVALIVDRGWAPLEGVGGAAAPGRADPPRGEVRVAGILTPGEGAGPFGSRRSSGPVKVTARIDLALLGRGLPYPIYPLYVLLQDQDPPQRSGFPRPGELPRLGEGPHFSYAMQWFLFAAVAVIGYAAVLRRAAKQVRRAATPQEVTTPGKAPLSS